MCIRVIVVQSFRTLLMKTLSLGFVGDRFEDERVSFEPMGEDALVFSFGIFGCKLFNTNLANFLQVGQTLKAF